MSEMETITLWRPVGPAELELLRDTAMRAFPPRLQAGLAGDGEQVERRMQRAIGWATAQRLMAKHPMLTQAHDWLEQTVNTALSQDGTQGTELFGNGHDGFLKNEGRASACPALIFHDSAMTV